MDVPRGLAPRGVVRLRFFSRRERKKKDAGGRRPAGSSRRRSRRSRTSIRPRATRPERRRTTRATRTPTPATVRRRAAVVCGTPRRRPRRTRRDLSVRASPLGVARRTRIGVPSRTRRGSRRRRSGGTRAALMPSRTCRRDRRFASDFGSVRVFLKEGATRHDRRRSARVEMRGRRREAVDPLRRQQLRRHEQDAPLRPQFEREP